ncbi:MAG: DUF2069 domain-containing protein [Cardiobacteriaceae bacterium]|nr:DUF2069 domain-containing protein [Cardiobacteriaceae bacterium]
MPPRKTLGHRLVIAALALLLLTFAWMGITMQGSLPRRLIGSAITLLPLLLFVRGAWQHDLRSYQALALLAPVYLFIGGVVWLWADWRIGLVICLASLALETGAILHNYQKRKPKKHPK